jgi:hypothetical protein
MIDEDNLEGRIHADYADPHLSDARLKEYRSLMSVNHITRLWGNGRSKPFELIVVANGWLDASCFDIKEPETDDRFCSAVNSLGDGWWLLRYEYR